MGIPAFFGKVGKSKRLKLEDLIFGEDVMLVPRVELQPSVVWIQRWCLLHDPKPSWNNKYAIVNWWSIFKRDQSTSQHELVTAQLMDWWMGVWTLHHLNIVFFSVPLDTILSFDEPGSLAHMINGIFTYIYRWFFMVNVCKYTSPMDPIYDPMGLKTYPSHTLGVHPKTRKLTLNRSLVFAPKMGAKLGEIPKTWAKFFSATVHRCKWRDMFLTRWAPKNQLEV